MRYLRALARQTRGVAAVSRWPAARHKLPLSLCYSTGRHGRHHGHGPPGGRRGGHRGGGFLKYIAVFGLSAGAVYYYRSLNPSTTEEVPEDAAPKVPLAKVQYEQSRVKPTSKEENRDLISPQHRQIKKSWENPGVYAWGSNSGRVIDPDSADAYVKTPKRIAYFDGQVLRDLKLSDKFGVAATERGDLVQWGTAFSSQSPEPAITLKGKNIIKVGVSADRVITLSSTGAVYSLPVSRYDQEYGAKPEEAPQSSWFSFWSASPTKQSALSYRHLTPEGSLSRGEKVTDISTGLEHCLMLTSKGRVFSAAASTASFPSKGQMGIRGLDWETRLAGAYDQPYEISALKGHEIVQVAAGDYHSVVLDKKGSVRIFGDNTYGQLGFPAGISFADRAVGGISESGASTASTIPTDDKSFQEALKTSGLASQTSKSLDVPTELPIGPLYAARDGLVPKVTSIAAGGCNTYFSVEASPASGREVFSAGKRPVTTVDLWACGQGNFGGLGNGKWTHVTEGPAKVGTLSSVFEFDQKSGKMVPIKLAALSVGSSHAAAVLGNATQTSASNKASENETNWGSDVMVWGGNEHYQLGTGKRTNANTPTYIGPMDRDDISQKGSRKSTVVTTEQRLQVAPRRTVCLGEGGKGRKVDVEQRVECGRFITAVYSGT